MFEGIPFRELKAEFLIKEGVDRRGRPPEKVFALIALSKRLQGWSYKEIQIYFAEFLSWNSSDKQADNVKYNYRLARRYVQKGKKPILSGQPGWLKVEVTPDGKILPISGSPVKPQRKS